MTKIFIGLLIIALAGMACAESPEELFNKTPLVNLEEFAFLLAMHGYDVTYVDGIYLLNGSDLREQYNLS